MFKKILILIIVIVIIGIAWWLYKYFSIPKVSPDENYCTTKSGKTMSLSEAKQIAVDGVCGGEGWPKDTHICNPDTGTWWIDFDYEIVKKGCNPACVVDIETKEAKINWRCTGLLD